MSDTRLEALVGQVLRAHGWTIGAAESCTGGLVMHRLTNIPGSSDYVMGGVVAYSNAVKQALLKVEAAALTTYGAVSEIVAAQMATGARALLGVDVAVSLTGIAGPGGGTPEKPVGLVYIGVAGPGEQVVVQRQVWSGDREAIKAASAEAALALVLARIGGE
ncbi:MAG: nicotinamide-nucleotide amidohydrolase family protein [Anaerolineae bacterium]|nr:nicotinamide-nucleotide amidohydrolase family protein [Anaerolineae bacterium]